jgi:hypothetical protein
LLLHAGAPFFPATVAVKVTTIAFRSRLLDWWLGL